MSAGAASVLMSIVLPLRMRGGCRDAAMRTISGFPFFLAGESLAHRFQNPEEQWNEEDGDQRRGEHAADDAGADRAQAVRPRAACDGKRYAAEDECERGHEDRAQPQSCRFDRRLTRRHALVHTFDGELAD